jgi:hypothetical protein
VESKTDEPQFEFYLKNLETDYDVVFAFHSSNLGANYYSIYLRSTISFPPEIIISTNIFKEKDIKDIIVRALIYESKNQGMHYTGGVALSNSAEKIADTIYRYIISKTK